ncbi:hypothetical protein KZZ52_59045 [Dactylosporangium sp. AC04546]|uniref:hypothetical protein n=1 Tax=Dactylosporangium sp. AC04546 TaxID=2862460 RepID=UPI001EDF88F8|nr:hypothetical protein [Dactylosporangium sp. AC04546]WVK83688.1 hypothetical protein KZZ52_59045 [Dactylosporangium sp. AC04546]
MGMRHLGLLLAVSALAACAAQPTDSAEPAAPSSSAASSPAVSSPAASPRSVAPEPTISLPSGVPKTKRPDHPTDDFPAVTVEGLIKVDGTCVSLVTGSVTWTLLLAPDAAKLRDGQKVKVVGVPNPNAFTACTGSPLTVSTATPL